MRNRLPKALLAALLATLALIATASADTRTFSNSARIAPADAVSGQPGTDAAHYPSQIKVAGAPGTITGVEVTLNGVSTAFTGDLDVLLVSPAGQKLLLMSDVSGRNPIPFANLTFSDTSPNRIPENDPIKKGVYKPTNLGGDDVFPRPAPSGPYNDGPMSTFDGAEPNGKWSLYVVDDAGADTNQIELGWDLTLVTTGGKIFRDNTPILAGDRESPETAPAIAAPYPSTIDVAGLDAKIDRVTVTLHDVDIEAASDTDLLLVGPDGRSVTLMSDVGGGNDLSNADITYDDAAETPVAFSQPIEEGAHKPGDDDRGGNPDEPLGEDVFPEPAPTGTFGGAMKAFKNSDPNGQWKLFMTDDNHGDVNAVNGGWSLNFTLLTTRVEEPAPPVTEPVPGPGPEPAPVPAPQPAPQPPAKPAPIGLTSLKLKPRAFSAKKGTTISYRLSAAAKVRFTVVREGKQRATLTKAGKPGANKLRFKPRKLTAGRYKLVATPIGGGKPSTIGFKVTRR